MLRFTILLAAIFGLGSCDYLESIFEVSIIKAMREAQGNLTKGTVQNCGKLPTDSQFEITWDPDPIVKGQQVTVAGYITFSQDFVEGELAFDTSLGGYDYPLACSDLGVASCKKGGKISMTKTINVPKSIPVPLPEELKVTARLKNNKGKGDEILCASAAIHIKQ